MERGGKSEARLCCLSRRRHLAACPLADRRDLLHPGGKTEIVASLGCVQRVWRGGRLDRVTGGVERFALPASIGTWVENAGEYEDEPVQDDDADVVGLKDPYECSVVSIRQACKIDLADGKKR